MEQKNDIISDAMATKIAYRVSGVCIVGNTALTIFKLAAGIVGNSGAMISDAVHSASDVFGTLIAMLGVSISKKKPDADHPYGHDRLECVAAIILAGILFITGLGIGKTGLQNIFSGASAETSLPGTIALAAAIISIVVKEWMFWYTRAAGQKINSGALMAEAWHHRSDALSSVGAFVGILGARHGFPILEPLASVIICLFILKAAYDIFRDAMDKMVDKSCDDETHRQITELTAKQDGVKRVDMVQARLFGAKLYVDIEIAADCRLTLTEGHEIAQQVHDAVEKEFPLVKHCMVHVNPYDASGKA